MSSARLVKHGEDMLRFVIKEEWHYCVYSAEESGRKCLVCVDEAGNGVGMTFSTGYTLAEQAIETDFVLPAKDAGVTVLGTSRITDNLIVPDLILGRPVVALGACAFYNCNFHSCTVPESVTKIGYMAFFCCYGLEEIDIKGNIDALEWSTFEYCYALKRVLLPSSLHHIRDEAFSHCSSLESLWIPERIETIGSFAFLDCVSLIELVFPPTLREISETALEGCCHLKHLVLPPSVEFTGSFSGITLPTYETIFPDTEPDKSIIEYYSQEVTPDDP